MTSPFQLLRLPFADVGASERFVCLAHQARAQADDRSRSDLERALFRQAQSVLETLSAEYDLAAGILEAHAGELP